MRYFDECITVRVARTLETWKYLPDYKIINYSREKKNDEFSQIRKWKKCLFYAFNPFRLCDQYIVHWKFADLIVLLTQIISSLLQENHVTRFMVHLFPFHFPFCFINASACLLGLARNNEKWENEANGSKNSTLT